MLATLLGGPLAAADRAPFETVRGWTVERRASDTGSPACRMTHTEKDAQGELAGVVIVSLDRGGLTLAVADRNWDFSAGDRFSVPILLDGKPAGATLIWTGDGQILRTALPETIVPALLDARTLSLRFADGDKPLVAGIHFRGGGAGLYPTFLSPKEDAKDEDLFTATGIMQYDEKDKLYRISSKDTDPGGMVADSASDEVENAFTFNDPKGQVTFKGQLNLLNAAPQTYLLSAGSARINIDSAHYRFNTLLAFTFPIPEGINTAIASKLVSANQEEKNDEAADDDLNRLSDKLLPLIGQKAVDAYRTKAQNQHVPLHQASPRLLTSLVLANANLRWSDKFNAFYSTGKLGVSNIMGTDVNAQMDGFVEIRKSANGDEASIYLESSPEVWIFYDFKPGNGPGALAQLAIITSEQEINDRLLAGSKNSAKATLEVVPATIDEKTQFVDHYLDQYKTKVKPAPKPKPKPGEKVVKEAPKEKEKKKDKEAEKEGF